MHTISTNSCVSGTCPCYYVHVPGLTVCGDILPILKKKQTCSFCHNMRISYFDRIYCLLKSCHFCAINDSNDYYSLEHIYTPRQPWLHVHVAVSMYSNVSMKPLLARVGMIDRHMDKKNYGTVLALSIIDANEADNFFLFLAFTP